MSNNFFSGSPALRRTVATAVAGLMTLGAGLALRIYSGSNNNVHVQEWYSQNVNGTGTGTIKGYITSSGALTLSGALNAKGGLLSNGVAVVGYSQTTADARYVNTFGDTMTGNLVIGNGQGVQAASTISGVTLKITGTMSGDKLSVSNTSRLGSGIIINRATDIGWSVQAAANQACNTTCTSACVFGEDTSVLGSFVACNDATADRCVCAGGT